VTIWSGPSRRLEKARDRERVARGRAGANDEHTERREVVLPLGLSRRNLIHPGRAIRTGQECYKGTATVALGTLYCVIEDLARRGVSQR
jgi:hypothetical protein